MRFNNKANSMCLYSLPKPLKAFKNLFLFNMTLGNSMSNHPGHDIHTSQILFIFLLFVDSVEMTNSCKFQPSTPYRSKVIEI